jgi:outer membrane lipoprotein-sorting protein
VTGSIFQARVLPFGLSVTVTDPIMPDGTSPAKHGVIPNIAVLPTAEDLAENRVPRPARSISSSPFCTLHFTFCVPVIPAPLEATMPFMKVKTTVGLLVTVLLAAAPAAAAQNLTLDQVLAKHYEAIGGLANWKAVQSMRATGHISLMPGTDAPLVITTKRPHKVRIEFTFQGMTGVQGYDGTTAWMIMPFMGKPDPEEMPPEMSKDIIEQGDMDGPLVDYKAKGHQVELVGMTETEGTKAYQLKVTLKNGDVQQYYLDAEYFVPIKIAGTRVVQGNPMDFETILSDYKDVGGGLMMPHSIDARPKGAPQGQTIVLDTVELNVEAPDSLFVMPKPAK